MLVATGYRDMRLYDSRVAKRRPVWEAKMTGTKMDVSSECRLTVRTLLNAGVNRWG